MPDLPRVDSDKGTKAPGALRRANPTRPQMVHLADQSGRAADEAAALRAVIQESNALQRETIAATKASTAEMRAHRKVLERIAAALEARPLG